MDGSSAAFSTWFPLIILWLIIYMQQRIRKQVKKMIFNKLKGEVPMEEIIKKYMNIPVFVNCIENDVLTPEGIITSYSDGWITFKPLNKEEETAINCNYIISIKPKKLKEKKKK